MWKMWDMLRRLSIPALGALGLLALVHGTAWSAASKVEVPPPEATFGSVPVTAGDNVLGQAGAPVTIVEYASFTCPHCARFHGDILPELKKAYIDTGKARLVYRDFPLDRAAFAASVVARCATGSRYFGIVDLLFREQSRWAGARDRMAALRRLATLAGISKKKLDGCLKNEKIQNAVLQQRLTATQEFEITSTPTLIVNGAKYHGGLTLEQFRAVIDRALAGK